MSESKAKNSELNLALNEVLMRLNEHANGTVGIDPLNLSDFVMRVTDNLGNANPIAVWDNLVTVFEQLNTILNKNECDKKGWSDLTYPGPLVYDMNSMVVHLLTCVLEHKCTIEESTSLIQLAWRISKAWAAILETDCETITSDIEIAEYTRDISPLTWHKKDQ
jgi:hypothetical protein